MRYFHYTLRDRQRRNYIGSVNTNQGLVEGAVEVKKEIRRHFESFFKESNDPRPIPEGFTFNRITEDDRFMLESQFRK